MPVLCLIYVIRVCWLLSLWLMIDEIMVQGVVVFLEFLKSVFKISTWLKRYCKVHKNALRSQFKYNSWVRFSWRSVASKCQILKKDAKKRDFFEFVIPVFPKVFWTQLNQTHSFVLLFQTYLLPFKFWKSFENWLRGVVIPEFSTIELFSQYPWILIYCTAAFLGFLESVFKISIRLKRCYIEYKNALP